MPLYIIILSLSLILLLLYIILYWRSYVPVKDAQPQSTNEQYPGISVIIITHDSDSILQHTIDCVANQNYPDFEIVVVNNASSDNTNDVIKRAAKQYPTLLRSTHLPQNRNGILHMTIATTLGVRAARKEWIVLLRPNSTPKDGLWLSSIADAINQGYDMCIGYNHYYTIDKTKWERQATRWYQRRQLLNYRAINRGKRKPIEACCSNFAFRKQDFMSNGGYGRWLNLPNYHEHLYATTFATRSNCTMLMQLEAQVETILPPIQELWQTEQQQTRKAYRRLSRATKLRRCYYSVLSILYILAALVLILGIALAMWPLPIDNSASLIGDNCLWLNALPPIPIIAPCAAIVFLAVSLIHLICKNHCRRRDNKLLNLPLVNDPSYIMENDDSF